METCDGDCHDLFFIGRGAGRGEHSLVVHAIRWSQKCKLGLPYKFEQEEGGRGYPQLVNCSA